VAKVDAEQPFTPSKCTQGTVEVGVGRRGIGWGFNLPVPLAKNPASVPATPVCAAWAVLEYENNSGYAKSQ